MGSTSIFHWLIVLLIVLLLFGAGKLPKVMGDLAKGIKNFKAGLKDGSEDGEANAAAIPAQQPAAPAPATTPVQAAPVQAAPATTATAAQPVKDPAGQH